MAVIASDDFDRGGQNGPIGGDWNDVFYEQHLFGDVDGHLSLGWDPTASTPTEIAAATIPAVKTPDGRMVSVPAQSFSCARVEGDVATFRPRRRNIYHNNFNYNVWKYQRPVAMSGFQVGHWLLYQELERDDDIEVGLRWRTPTLLSTAAQVSPAGFVDPGADATAMALVPIYDISLAHSVFIQNAFRNPENNVFDPDKYRILGADGEMHRAIGPQPNGAANGPWRNEVTGGFSSGEGGTHTMALRTSQGKVAMYVDGVRMVPPIGSEIDEQEVFALDVPTEYQGRTKWGIQVIGIQIDPTLGMTLNEATHGLIGPPEGSEVIDEPTPSLVDYWYAAEFEATSNASWDTALYELPE